MVGVGKYGFTWNVGAAEALGTWTAEWSGIVQGLDVDGVEQIEVVLPGWIATGPLDFLIKPDDYHAIRNVLGFDGSEVDLTDVEIERLLFAPQAERRVKNAISNWDTQMGDPDRLYVLRMATAYGTAALIAESLARGGSVSRVYPNSDRGSWESLAEILWQRHGEWLAMAEAYDDTPSEQFAFSLLIASGPTKALALDPDPTQPLWTWGWPVTWSGWHR